MPLSPEARAAGRAKSKANREARKAAAATAVASSPPSTGDPLKDLAALIVQAAAKDAADDKIIEQFTQLLEHIDFKKHPELRDHPAMQNLMQKAFDREVDTPKANERLVPGTVIGTGLSANAVAWTWEHVKFLHDQDPTGMYKMMTIMCPKTEQVIINGLGVWFPEGQEVRWYAPWVTDYMKSIRIHRENTRHAQWLFKVGPWAPNIPVELQPAPDADWMEDSNAMRVRAEADAGMYRPGMGWNPAVDGKRWMPGGGPAPEVAVSDDAALAAAVAE